MNFCIFSSGSSRFDPKLTGNEEKRQKFAKSSTKIFDRKSKCSLIFFKFWCGDHNCAIRAYFWKVSYEPWFGALKSTSSEARWNDSNDLLFIIWHLSCQKWSSLTRMFQIVNSKSYTNFVIFKGRQAVLIWWLGGWARMRISKNRHNQISAKNDSNHWREWIFHVCLDLHFTQSKLHWIRDPTPI